MAKKKDKKNISNMRRYGIPYYKSQELLLSHSVSKYQVLDHDDIPVKLYMYEGITDPIQTFFLHNTTEFIYRLNVKE